MTRLAQAARLLPAIALLMPALPTPAHAEMTVSPLFSDHMVLQADKPVVVWGTAEPGEGIAVSFDGQTATATAGADGRWKAMLPPLKPSTTGKTLRIRGSATLERTDVVVGEVWLASGQSNMALVLKHSKDGKKAVADSSCNEIRLFNVPQRFAKQPQADVKAQWAVSSPQSAADFSAVAYYFGRELQREHGGAVGLIDASFPGTPIEEWISNDAQQASTPLREFFLNQRDLIQQFQASPDKPRYDEALAQWKQATAEARQAGKQPPKRPEQPWGIAERKSGGRLFNGMIAPLIPFPIRGVLWYQGEANAPPAQARGNRADLYRIQLELLIADWRQRWGDDALPFAWVQLPNYEAEGRDWAAQREAMRQVLAVPHTGMAVTIDLGLPHDIHPWNKLDVGRRLASWALEKVYQTGKPGSSPLPVRAERKDGGVRVEFAETADGLVARGGSLNGFELLSAEGTWVPAAASIQDSGVVVTADSVAAPQAVRYAWRNNPSATLYNSAGLPATPFTLSLP